jgi:hypothetical protein
MANSLDFRVKNGLVVATTATIQSTTSATSTLTGALTVAGGVGIRGDLYLGGDLYGSLGGGSTGTLVYQSATGTTAFLTVGLNGYVLQSNGTNPTWVALSGVAAGSATTASNLANGGPGQVPYQSGAGSTQFIATGTAGTVLVSNGTSAPTFNNTLTLASTTAATSTQTGALRVLGGVGVGGYVYAGGIDIISPNTDANTVGNIPFDIQGAWMRIGDSNSAFTATSGIGIKFHDAGNVHYSMGSTGTNFVISQTSTNGDQLFPTGRTDILTLSSAGIVTVNATTASTSTASGALQVLGGVGIGGALYVGGTSNLQGVRTTDISASGTLGVTSTSILSGGVRTTDISASGTLGVTSTSILSGGVRTTDISASGTLGVTGTSFLAGLRATNIVASGTLGVTGTSILAGVQASNIVASGTLGVTGTSFLAGVQVTNIVASGTLGVTGTSTLGVLNATSGTFSGTLGVTGTSVLSGLTTVTNVTSATSTTTGALQVRGGVGIGGTLYVGGLRADATTSATTWGVFYNTATKELTTATAGSPAGSAITATYILTSATIVNSTYYPAFVDSNNATATSESVYTTSSFSVNPASGVLTVKSLVVNTNSNGVNILIGDDAWIGDIDQANTLRVMGNQNNANGYIVFGNSNTLALGRAGTGALTYGGDFVVNGTTAASSTATGALQVAGGAGIGGNLYAGGDIFSRGTKLVGLNIQEFTATASQTTFTITNGYTVGTVQVFANGIQLGSGAIVASNGTTVVLNNARNAGDIVRVISGGASTQANNIQSYSLAMSVALGA